MTKKVTRFAPSPTGFLHLGGIRTALINYILIQQNKLINPESKFLLRIEDTDKLRSKDEYKKSIIQGLKWMGMNCDDDEYLQSKRIDRHVEIAEMLLKKNFAFKCICTAEELEKIRNELSKDFKSPIKIDYKHDPDLIAGLVIQIGSMMVDTSIKSKLRQLEKNMIEA